MESFQMDMKKIFRIKNEIKNGFQYKMLYSKGMRNIILHVEMMTILKEIFPNLRYAYTIEDRNKEKTHITDKWYCLLIEYDDYLIDMFVQTIRNLQHIHWEVNEEYLTKKYKIAPFLNINLKEYREKFLNVMKTLPELRLLALTNQLT